MQQRPASGLRRKRLILRRQKRFSRQRWPAGQKSSTDVASRMPRVVSRQEMQITDEYESFSRNFSKQRGTRSLQFRG